MLFFKVMLKTYSTINSILNEFAYLFRLIVNNQKSKVWFSSNLSRSTRKTMASVLSFKVVSEVGKFLGTYMDKASDRMHKRKEIMQKVNKRLLG